jgi:hypothetical protein
MCVRRHDFIYYIMNALFKTACIVYVSLLCPNSTYDALYHFRQGGHSTENAGLISGVNSDLEDITKDAIIK